MSDWTQIALMSRALQDHAADRVAPLERLGAGGDPLLALLRGNARRRLEQVSGPALEAGDGEVHPVNDDRERPRLAAVARVLHQVNLVVRHAGHVNARRALLWRAALEALGAPDRLLLELETEAREDRPCLLYTSPSPRDS